MGPAVYTISCLLTLLGGALSCPGDCVCSDTIIDLQTGEDVDCSGRYLDHLPSISGGALKLDFSSNRLEVIPTRINLLIELRELDLSDNRLGLRQGIADNLFSTLTHLKALDLSDNYLSSFTANTFNGLLSLEKLDLRENYLRKLPLGFFQSLLDTTFVCLGGNQWNCGSCEFRETLRKYLSYGQNNLVYLCHSEAPICASPPNLYGSKISEVSLEEIPACSEESSVNPSWNSVSTEPDTSTKFSTTTDDFVTSFGRTSASSGVSDRKTTTVVIVSSRNSLVVEGKSETTTTPGYDNRKESIDYITSEGGIGVPSNRFLSGNMNNTNDNQMFIPLAIVMLGVMLLLIFIVFSIMLWKMQRKSKKGSISCTTSSVDPFLKHSPWPLLQGRQLPETEEPVSPASSQATDYEEIPFEKGDNFDGYVTRKEMPKIETEMSNGRLGAARKGFELYSMKIDNFDDDILHRQSNPSTPRYLQASPNEFIDIEIKSTDTAGETALSQNAPYMEMRSSVAEGGWKDLYAPLGT